VLDAFLLTQDSSDLQYHGLVWFGSPSATLLGRYQETDYIRRDRLVQGMFYGRGLVGTLSEPVDSLSLEGIINPAGQLEFGSGLFTMDGGSFTAVEWTAKSLRGWWYPPGAVVPEQLGYFCAYPMP
jgi:hypothetical protein